MQHSEKTSAFFLLSVITLLALPVQEQIVQAREFNGQMVQAQDQAKAHALNGENYATVSLSLSAPRTSIEAGTTVTLTARVTGTNAKVIWRSLYTPVATVSQSGVVTGIKEGKATITATVGSMTEKITMTVTKSSAMLSLTAMTLKVEQTKALAMAIGGKRVKPVWKSMNAPVASVDQNGIVTAHKEGKATITATFQGSGVRTSLSGWNEINNSK